MQRRHVCLQVGDGALRVHCLLLLQLHVAVGLALQGTKYHQKRALFARARVCM